MTEYTGLDQEMQLQPIIVREQETCASPPVGSSPSPLALSVAEHNTGAQETNPHTPSPSAQIMTAVYLDPGRSQLPPPPHPCRSPYHWWSGIQVPWQMSP